MFPSLLARSARAVFVLVAILAFAFAGTAFAQTDVTTSRISGTAKDSEGGALPGVTVEGKNQETGLTANATTNSQGFYQLVNLPTGTLHHHARPCRASETRRPRTSGSCWASR